MITLAYALNTLGLLFAITAFICSMLMGSVWVILASAVSIIIAIENFIYILRRVKHEDIYK